MAVVFVERGKKPSAEEIDKGGENKWSWRWVANIVKHDSGDERLGDHMRKINTVSRSFLRVRIFSYLADRKVYLQ